MVRQGKRDITRVLPTALLLMVLGGALLPSGPADAGPSHSVRWDPKDARVSNPDTLFEGEQEILYEPTIAIDPRNPRNMIAFAIDLSVQNIKPELWSVTRAYRSTDGGRTWKDNGPVRYTPEGDDITQSGDPVALFDRNGNAYYASLANPEGRERGIYVHRSRDGGKTWPSPVLAVAAEQDEESDTCTGTDKEWLSADPDRRTLYMTYTLFTFTCSGSGMPTDTYTRLSDIGVYLTTSRDGGKTWTASKEIWGGYALGAIPKAASDGTLHVVFWATVATPPTHCPSAIGVLAAKGGGRPFISIVVGSSEDGGKNWEYHQQPICDFIPGEIIKPGRFVGGSFMPSLTVDQNGGAVYVAYPAYRPSENRFTIELLSSDDEGASWAAPMEVTPGEADARMPVIRADGGVLRMVYVETTGMKDQDQETTDGTARTLYIESSNGGATWSAPLELSSEVGHPREFTELGDYISMDVVRGRIAAVWTDARNGAEAGEIRVRTGSITRPVARSSGPSIAPRGYSPLLLGPWPLNGSKARVPPAAAPHRGVARAAILQAAESCSDREHRIRLRRVLKRGSSGSLRTECSALSVLTDASKVGEDMRYRIVFREYEGWEADLLLARGSSGVLLKIMEPRSAPGMTEVVVHRF